MKVLLIITTGQTDAQIIIDGTRRPFYSKTICKTHLEIQQRKNWTFEPDDCPKGEEYSGALPEGSIVLCTPKLEAVRRYVDERDIRITKALVLETQRPNDPKDPVMSGTFVAQRIQEIFDCQPNILPYLTGDERLDDQGTVIAEHIVTRIEQGIQNIFEAVQLDQVILSANGGIPKINDLVKAMVKLYASHSNENRAHDISLINLSVPDRSQQGSKPPAPGQKSQLDTAIEESIATSPVVSYLAKHQALSLLEKGHIFGAWGAAQLLEKSCKWTRVVEWMYAWASSRSLPPDCNLPYLTDESWALRSALQTEFALRADDLPNAIHGTVKFMESALWDHLRKRGLKVYDPINRFYTFPDTPPQDLIFSGKEKDKKDRPFQLRSKSTENTPYYYIDDLGYRPLIIGQKYLHKQKFIEFADIVYREIRHLRNDIAHTVPTPQLIATAKEMMEKQGLWKNNSFLQAPLILAVLAELDLPVSIEVLLKDIRHKILSP